MTTEQFASWLKQWMSRHAVKSPSSPAQSTYTQEVMSRIEALSPSPDAARSVRVWWQRPQWMLSVGCAVAAAAVVVVVAPQSKTELARLQPAVPRSIMLAETPKATNALQAIWQEMETLEKLDDEAGADPVPVDDDDTDKSSDELLEELEWIDSASSTRS